MVSTDTQTGRELDVAVKAHPFDSKAEMVRLPEGLTLLQMVDAQSLDPVMRAHVVIQINGDVIPRESWHLVRPKASAIVSVHIVPSGGGGGGGKNPLKTVLTIAVMAAAAYFAPMLAGAIVQGGPAMAWSSTQLMVLKAAVSGAITMVGNAVINAVIPPPKPGSLDALSGAQSYGGPPESPTLSITGARNRANPYGVVTRVLGRHRVFPTYAANPYTENAGDSQYLNLLFDFGYGPLELSDLRIGTNPISQFDGVDIQIREGWSDDEDVTLYRNQNRSDGYNLKITNAGGAQVLETQSETDEIIVDVSFQGLVRYDNSGNRRSTSVEMQFEYRVAGSGSAWTAHTGFGEGGTDVSTVSVLTQTDGQRWISYQTDTISTDGVTLTLDVPTTYAGASIHGMKFAVYVRSEGQTKWKRAHEDAEYVLAGNQNVINVQPPVGAKAEIKVENVAMAFTSGTWDGQNDSGSGYDAIPSISFIYTEPSDDGGTGKTTFTADSAQQVRKNIRIIPGSRNKWEVRITRITADNTDSQIRNDSYVTALRSVTYEDPVNYPVPHCIVAMRIKATDQLNGVVDQFNAIAESLHPTWDGAAWTDYVKTRNAAWHYCDVLRGTANKEPLDAARLNLTEIKAWADANDTEPPETQLPGAVTTDSPEPYWTCDLVIDYPSTVFETLKSICATSRASVAMPEGRFSVVRDIAQATPVQMFTPRNSWNFRGNKAFYEQPHALKVKFVDPDSDWKQRVITVYDDGYDSSTATQFEDLGLIGVTRASQAWREGRYHIAVGRLRPETFDISTDIENLIATRGDLVLVAHDVPSVGGDYGRITSLTTSGSDITAITLDEYVTMQAGPTYSIKVRHADGSFSTHIIDTVPGETQTVTLTTPTPISGGPLVGDLCVAGESATVTGSYIVKDVASGPNGSATLTLLDYAADIQTADSTTIPAYTPQISYDPDAAPPPAIETVTVEEINERASRRYVPKHLISWDMPDNSFASAYEIYVTEDGVTVLLDIVPQRHYTFDGIHRGDRYCYKIIGVSTSGRKISLGEATEFCATVVGVAPPNVAQFDVNVLGSESRLTWSVDSDIVHGWQIRYSPVVDASLTWGEMPVLVKYVSYPTSSVNVPAMAGTYAIKALDMEGYESATPTIVTVASVLDEMNAISTVTESPAWAGAKTNVVRHDGSIYPDGRISLTGTQLVSEWSLVSALPIVSIGEAGYEASGTYEFSNTVDLGAVYTSRITLELDAYGASPLDKVSLWALVSARESIASAPSALWDVDVQIRTTDDDPAGAPTWTDWQNFVVGDYTCRAMEFRVLLYSYDSDVTPVVKTMSVYVDMPDRIVSEFDLTSGAGAYTVDWTAVGTPQAYFSSCVPSVNITASNLQNGDYYTISSKTDTGFQITFYNSSDVAVSRQFDYHAVGYGYAH